ncbi:MAG: hypothetical protein ACREUT_01360 [Steroidobacteraceae bacterium]
MIRLVVIAEHGPAELVTAELVFRITGAAVWVPERVSRGKPLVRYSSGVWQYSGRQWSGVRFEGPCRLLFGLPREAPSISDELSGISIHGTTLTAGGLPFAIYEADRDMWHGVGTDRWWHAFRIEDAGMRKGKDAAKDPNTRNSSDPPADPQSQTKRPSDYRGELPIAPSRH